VNGESTSVRTTPRRSGITKSISDFGMRIAEFFNCFGSGNARLGLSLGMMEKC
jgi:hypothetical protein